MTSGESKGVCVEGMVLSILVHFKAEFWSNVGKMVKLNPVTQLADLNLQS